jgi:hypothetical protein
MISYLKRIPLKRLILIPVIAIVFGPITYAYINSDQEKGLKKNDLN